MADINPILTNINDDEEKSNVFKKSKKSIKSWLSCSLQLEEFDIRGEYFVISGYINVFWRWPPQHQIKQKVSGLMHKYLFDENENDNLEQFQLCNKNKHHNDMIIKVKDLLHETIKFNNKLPIDCRRLFDQQNEVGINYREAPSLYYNTTTGASHLCINLKAAKLSENLELFAFPFDFQFLNVKCSMKYRKYPLYKPNSDGETENEDIICAFHELPRGDSMDKIWSVALKVTTSELLENEIEMIAPWIYFNQQHQCIRLRIITKEGYHVWTLLFPLFLVISSSFCTFFIDDNDEKLSYTITVLLTYAATQYLMSTHLPKLSEMMFCHYYILTGYIVQGLVIIWSVLNCMEVESKYINTNLDIVFIICCLLWIIINCMYLVLWIKVRFCLSSNANIINKSNRCNKCRYLYELNGNWENRANDEIVAWNKKKHSFQRLRVSDGSKIDVE